MLIIVGEVCELSNNSNEQPTKCLRKNIHAYFEQMHNGTYFTCISKTLTEKNRVRQIDWIFNQTLTKQAGFKKKVQDTRNLIAKKMI